VIRSATIAALASGVTGDQGHREDGYELKYQYSGVA